MKTGAIKIICVSLDLKDFTEDSIVAHLNIWDMEKGDEGVRVQTGSYTQ